MSPSAHSDVLESAEVFGAIEEALGQHPAFGDSSYIFGQLRLCLERRLANLSERLPSAGELLAAVAQADGDAVDDAIGDTVVRCAIIHAHTQLETGGPYGLPSEDCDAVFTATARRLRQGQFGTTLDDGSLPRLGPEPYHGWIWSDEHSSDVFGRGFRYLLKHRYEAIPRTPSADEVALLQTGARLVQDLLPSLTPSTLRHAHVIACVPSAGGWKGVASSSQFHLGGTIFLGSALHNAWWVAEHLLHEALHQKLYDFRQAHLLLNEDREEGDAPVRSPWNSPRLSDANHWDVHRVFAAFHVYAHLALLTQVAELRAPELEETYGPFRSMLSSTKALDRAHYLGEQLRDQCWDRLGIAGQSMTEWLLSVLEFLNPSPPPKGACVHLCLDLYEKEAGKVATALQERGSALTHELVALAKDEVEGTRRVLSAIDAQKELDRLDRAVGQYDDEELGTRFPEIRRVIGRALKDAAYDRYRLTESGDGDELVNELVAGASQGLYAVLTGYPPAVAAAKVRAHELKFGKSCDDQVGRLLTVLAASVPPGGRILELGTGAGVGTAWITAGVGARTDIELVSVEIDARLSDATRAWQWPAYVEIRPADASEVLDTLGTFDLVFADAAPVKYGQTDSVVKTLRPGGVLVVDDLHAGPETTDVQHAEKAALRRSVLDHPDLHALEIEAWTGAILASRSV